MYQKSVFNGMNRPCLVCGFLPKRLLPKRLLPLDKRPKDFCPTDFCPKHKKVEIGRAAGTLITSVACCRLLFRILPLHAVRIVCSIRIKISLVLNTYVVMTSSLLLHKVTENLKKNKRFPSTKPFSDYPYRAYCVYR